MRLHARCQVPVGRSKRFSVVGLVATIARLQGIAAYASVLNGFNWHDNQDVTNPSPFALPIIIDNHRRRLCGSIKPGPAANRCQRTGRVADDVAWIRYGES